MRKRPKTPTAVNIIAIGMAAVMPLLREHNLEMNNIRSRYQKLYAQRLQDFGEIVGVVRQLQYLCGSFDGLTKFCNLMTVYFQMQFQQFKNWGMERQSEAEDIEYRSWSAQKCATWIIDLDRARFKQYEAAIVAQMVEKQKDGSQLKKITAMWLEDLCGVESADAKAMETGIQNVVVKGEVKYKYVKKTWDDEAKWMEARKQAIELVNASLAKIQTETGAAFIEKGVTPTTREPVLLSTFKNVEISPQKSAKKILQQYK